MAKYTQKVILNWYGELHTLYTTASSDSQALMNAKIQLAQKLGISRYKVRQYYNLGTANHTTERRQDHGKTNR